MIMRNGKVLLGKRKGSFGSNTYGWVGGHLEFGESLEECAIREAYEETGLKVSSLKFLCLSNIIAYDTHYVDLEFTAEAEIGEPQTNEPDKVESWDWYDLSNLPTPLFQAVELAIKNYKKGTFYDYKE
jgi:8-oxo-dGTP diphosphatase